VFGAADRIMGAPTTGLELGRTLARLGLLLEARDRLLKVARYPIRPDEPEPYTQAREQAKVLAEELAARIASLRVEVLTVTGPVTGQAAVHLRIDDKPVAPEIRALPRSLDPGPHSIEVSAKGYAPQRLTVLLAEREQRDLQLLLVPSTAADETTARDGQAGAGADDTGPSLSPAAYVGFGVGAAAIIAGTVTGILTLMEKSDLADACPNKQCPPEQSDNLDHARTMGNVSTGCFVVGVVGMGVGFGTLLMHLTGGDEPPHEPIARRPSQTAVELRPLIGPGAIGLAGRF